MDQSQQASLALKAAKCGVWEWHIDDEKVVFSSNYYLIHGYEPNEFPHKFEEWEKRVHPDDIAAANIAIQQYLAGKLEKFTIEFRFKSKTGTWMWFLGQGEITDRDETGKPTRFVGFDIDISQIKKIEQALHDSEATLASVLRSAPIGIGLVADREFIFINNQFAQMLGYSVQELIGKKSRIIYPSDEEFERVGQHKYEDIKKNGTGSIETIMQKKDRTLIDVFLSSTLVDQEDLSQGVTFSALDITEKKLSEKKLRESELKFRLFADYTYDWEYWINPQGDYVYVSPSCEHTTGYRPDEFITNPKLILDLVPPDYLDEVSHHYSDERRNMTPLTTMEFPIKTKAGDERWLEHHCSPVFDEQGNYAGRRGNNRDITDRKKAEAERLVLEAQLSQKHKMEAVGYMAGGMAHNFNNNLGIILGNVELSLLKQPPGGEAISLLKNAKIAISRSRDLVQKIIVYSRQGVLAKVSVRLTEIVDETISLLQATLPSTVNLQKRYESACETSQIHADPSQIQEVLINLCNNAVQAMEERGTLTISLQLVDLKQRDIPAQFDCLPGHYAKLSIQDTGSGIAPELIDYIFDPFFSTKEECKGAGMGLATVQGTVAQHGGLIKVNSLPGKGAIFDLYFPLIDDIHEAGKTVTYDASLPRGKEQILYVDDNEMLASLGERMLSEMGYNVAVSSDSQEALKLFSANAERFDLVITDQTMPNLTGQELIQEVKQICPDMPTILCTGYSSQIDEDKAKELGASAFMMKPIDFPKLLQIMRQLLDENG